ncbi:PREDICTED: sodium/potassium/calcium exchanger 4 isoform X5 [Cercocebus atys]|uniref:sodium/potassium/calcium exchanger 4 isoform X5 n=1 Tax=Cercocebus atys TaxID=9531 RepID=UPI0005F4C6F1|nr:PREDICTED: sodium/potassium/calcium exchanger 4 isoform X5 [Cercocebus atys]
MALRGTLRPLKVRRRREMLPQQVGFVCAVLALVCCASGLFGNLGHKTASASKRVLPDTWRNRKLMAPVNGTQTAKNCTDPAIHEFPADLFSNKERQHGAVLLHILGALYMFYALAIVCDDFFVPSLEKICERLHLSEDVAGATFMAAGSSTPELFASVIGVFITHGDVGVGTIVGSAVFNILCIIGVCGLFAGQVVRLTWWAVCRDSVYYTISVIVLIVFIYDEQIVWWEGLVLIILYVFYILIMKYNVKMQAFFTIKQKSIANGNPVNSELEAGNDFYDGSYDDPSVPLLRQVKEKPQYGKNPVVMVDEIMSSSPPKFTFPEAGLRIMITNKFGPRTRLRMASRIIINERQRLINSANGVSSKPLQNGRHENIENGNVPVENPEDPQQNQEQQPPPQPPPPEPEPVEAAFLSPFSMPGLGDMAVSNTIGSNVFDILVGLGVPWGLQTMVVNYGSTVKINSRGLVYSVVLLLGSVALTVLGIHLNKWQLDRKLGVYVLVLYAIFLCFSIMIEFNVFTFVNLPMCREDD